MDPPGAREHSAALLGAFFHKISLYEQDLTDSIKYFATDRPSQIQSIEDILKKYPRIVSPESGELVIEIKKDDFVVSCYLSADNTTRLFYSNRAGTKAVVESPYISMMCLRFVTETPNISWIGDMTSNTLQLQHSDNFFDWIKTHEYTATFDDVLEKIHKENSK